MDIVFATGNAHKATEAGNALGKSFTLIMPKDLGITEEIPENGDTLEANALEKAQYLCVGLCLSSDYLSNAATNGAAVIDGWFVASVHSSR